MQIKIQCGCATRYSFEVEPVNGRMPVRVNCPSCGADGTELANAVIQEGSGRPAEPRPKVRISASLATGGPPTEPPGEPTSTNATQDMVCEFCPKHSSEPATEHCFVCQKPICLKCMEQFGYLCSVYCQNQAAQRRLQVPVYQGHKAVRHRKERRKEKWIVAGVALFLMSIGAVLIWHDFVGSRPRMVFSIPLPKLSASSVVAELVTPDEALLLKDNRLTLYDARSGKEKWSTALSGGKPASRAAADSSFLFEETPPSPCLQISGQDIWTFSFDHVTRVDRSTGKIKTEVPISHAVRQVTFTAASLLAVAGDEMMTRYITHIALPGGTVRMEEVTEVNPAKPGKAKPVTSKPSIAQALQFRRPNYGGDPDSADVPAAGLVRDREFFPAGDNVIQLKARLLETRMVAYEAMKKPGESTLNKPGLTARDSMKAAGELLNEMQRDRTGGVALENESRYEVTLRRLAPANATEWTGEVNGPPMVFPLKTVDILVAGKSLTVFNKKNSKLWDAKLTYPISENPASGYEEAEDASAPCLESGGSLYFWDKGVLTAFDLRSGNARWRVTSVGISRIVQDNHGMLYVATTTASPDSIQYSQQIKLGEKEYPALLKIDPGSGKVLWRTERIGDQCFASGKFVYVTRSETSGLDMMKAGMSDGGVPVHFRIYRVTPGNGALSWEYYQPKGTRRVQVRNNRILLQFADEIQVVGF